MMCAVEPMWTTVRKLVPSLASQSSEKRVNKNVDWKTAAELVGIAAIVASILFRAAQIRQSQQIAENERAYSLLANRLALSLAIADHAAICDAANAGRELDEVEATTAEVIGRGL